MTTREAALKLLYTQQKEAKIALGRAENRPGVTLEELNNLHTKLAAIDWLLPLAIAADNGREILPQARTYWDEGKEPGNHENGNFKNQG